MEKMKPNFIKLPGHVKAVLENDKVDNKLSFVFHENSPYEPIVLFMVGF